MKVIIGLIEHIGDIVACEPVSRYVRNKYPKAEISWAVLGRYRELIDVNPNIDTTVVLDCLTDWIKLTRHGAYNEIIDLHVNYRVCGCCRVPLVKLHGNPHVNAYEWFDYGALLEAFSQGAGLPKLSVQPQVYLGPQHKEAVDNLKLPANYCVIHRDSNDINKDWLPEHWCTIAKWIRKDLGLEIVEVGAGKATGKSPLHGLAIDLINRTSVLETAEVIRRAQFFAGIDSGPAHIANALQIPGIILLGRLGIFRQYNPFTGFYASALPDVKIVRNPTGPTREIPVEEVMEAIRYINSLLAERKLTGAQKKRPKPASSSDIKIPKIKDSERNIIRASGLFDDSWYILHYPQTLELDLDPLDHFIAIGGNLGYASGPSFDSAKYLKLRPDVAQAGVNPLVHYLRIGKKREGMEAAMERPVERHSCEDIVITASQEETQIEGDEFTSEVTVPRTLPANEIPRVFAFYLPQFHPIPENNYGHRMGFTEWDNVIKAKPLFNGHYQPRIPGELGYYDLRATEVIREQVRLATEHGITGFCFYYYYFHGKRLLYKPIENYIKSDIKAPFFFLWANENWSRRWDGGDNEVIIAQQHSREDDLAFIRDLVEVFSDDRYVKIDGKPILMVYKTHLFPNILETTELWRSEIVKHGFPDLYLVMVDDWTSDPPHPRELGFDASYEIPTNIVPDSVLSNERDSLDLGEDFKGRIVDYPKFAQLHMSRSLPQYKRFRTVMLPWDNTPRYASRAMVQINNGGDAYKMWLTQALIDTRDRYAPQERIVFLHSWNEWCEGTNIEPDGRYGRRYLEETRDAMVDFRALAAIDETGENSAVIALLQRLMRERSRSTFLSIQAVRNQMFAEIERTRREMYGSRSWRATAPLRWIYHRLHGRRN
jgi:ADP-heptose:LPS heptosyltransferase